MAESSKTYGRNRQVEDVKNAQNTKWLEINLKGFNKTLKLYIDNKKGM